MASQRILRAALPLVVLLFAIAPAAWPSAAHADDGPPAIASLAELLGTRTPQLSATAVLDPARDPGNGLSLGNTSTGQLRAGVPLPLDGDHLAVLSSHHKRRAYFAAENLAQILNDVAQTLHSSGAPRLVVGDASAESGGDLPRHASHNSGRDVDIAFYLKNAAGESVEARQYVAFRDASTLASSDGTWRFDLERNWALVEALIRHPEVEVQYVFVYEPLRQRLLAHAAQQGVEADVIARAERILRQPGDSAPHDDHFHLRVFCSERDRLEGCDNRAPFWPWAEVYEGSAGARSELLVRALELDPSLAVSALPRLVSMRARGASLALAQQLAHPELAVRDAARAALAEIGVAREAYPWVATAAAREADAATRTSLYALVGASQRLDAVAFLTGAAARETDAGARLAAVRALIAIDHPATVGALVELLTAASGDARVVGRAIDALRLLTNQSGPDPQSVEASEVAVWWLGWWLEHHAAGRDAWLLSGFRAAGVELEGLRKVEQVVPALIAAQTAPEGWIAHNAHRVLLEVTQHWIAPSVAPQERQKRWQRWWRQARSAPR